MEGDKNIFSQQLLLSVFALSIIYTLPKKTKPNWYFKDEQ
jgi:hypothetical protein